VGTKSSILLSGVSSRDPATNSFSQIRDPPVSYIKSVVSLAFYLGEGVQIDCKLRASMSHRYYISRET